MHVAGAALTGAVGMIASGFVHSAVPGLIALSIAAIGIFSSLPVFWPLPTAFLTGTAAAGAIALINSFGNLGGFVGPYAIGRVRTATGSFTIPVLIVATSLIIGAVLALRVRRHEPT